MKQETEGFLMAAQDQALRTNAKQEARRRGMQNVRGHGRNSLALNERMQRAGTTGV